jgi:Vam6/Vps39-like protein vacuolar protein sorting-associated protein 39
MLTYLVAGCRRKVVIYTYKDGELQQTQESPLPHSPRTITFMSDWVVCFAYTTTDFVRFDLRKLAVGDVSFPPPVTTTVGSGPTGVAAAAGSAAVGALGGAMSNIGMSGITTGISGLTGYMTLGIGSKTSKPNVVRVAEKETLILKESQLSLLLTGIITNFNSHSSSNIHNT